MKLRTLALALLLVAAENGVALAQQNGVTCANPVVPYDLFSVNATGLKNGLSTDLASHFFYEYGLTASWTPSQSPLEIIDYAMDYGGDGAQQDKDSLAAGYRNILKQANGDPVTYTLTFATPVSQFAFRRAPLHAGSSGVTNPTWKAVAYDQNGAVVATVNEAEIRSFVDVPGRTFLLAGNVPIKSVTFFGDDHNFDGQANAVLDDMGWCP